MPKQFLTLVATTLFVLCLSAFARAADASKPNIVIIVGDDLGYADLSCQKQSEDVKTPNIDTLAAAGVRFTSGYVSCPVCSPTRAGLITGRYQQRFGHYENTGPGGPGKGQEFGLPLNQKTIADVLKAQGYATGMVGKWHLGYEFPMQPNQRGFDEFFGFLPGQHSYVDDGGTILRNGKPVAEKEYLTDAFTREACAFIDKHHEHPFFLYLPYNAVHTPLNETPEKYRAGTEKITDPKRQTFVAMLSAMDAGVGEVRKTLQKHDLDNEKTIIVFFSDNGGPTLTNTSSNKPLARGKGTVYEGGVRTPSMIRWAGHIPEGKVIDTPMIQLDYIATAAVAAGAQDEAKKLKFDGVDLVPFLNGKAENPHEALFWKYGSQWAVRSGDLKLLQDTSGAVKLFNLKDDIGETTDLAAKQPDDVKRVKAMYDEWDKNNIPPLWHSPGGKKSAGGGED